jgi:hypothetical protein
MSSARDRSEALGLQNWRRASRAADSDDDVFHFGDVAQPQRSNTKSMTRMVEQSPPCHAAPSPAIADLPVSGAAESRTPPETRRFRRSPSTLRIENRPWQRHRNNRWLRRRRLPLQPAESCSARPRWSRPQRATARCAGVAQESDCHAPPGLRQSHATPLRQQAAAPWLTEFRWMPGLDLPLEHAQLGMAFL